MGYFDDSSDDESDCGYLNHLSIANKKKKSIFDDSFVGLGSDSEYDSDEDDDESFMGAFRKSQQANKSQANKINNNDNGNDDDDLLKGKAIMVDCTEKTLPEEFTEVADDDDEEQDYVKVTVVERVYRETNTDWFETVNRLRKNTARTKRGASNVAFVEPLVTCCLEYQQSEDSVLSVNDEHHVAEDHDEIPWYDQDYEELPWYAQPDLDEDDALTALCKKVLVACGKEGEENEKRLQEHAERVEAKVIGFALKLRHRARSPIRRERELSPTVAAH